VSLIFKQMMQNSLVSEKLPGRFLNFFQTVFFKAGKVSPDKGIMENIKILFYWGRAYFLWPWPVVTGSGYARNEKKRTG